MSVKSEIVTTSLKKTIIAKIDYIFNTTVTTKAKIHESALNLYFEENPELLIGFEEETNN